MDKDEEFVKELISLINRFSMENGSNTPDFLLADFLFGCLDTYNKTVAKREKWYGREPTAFLLNP